MGDPPMDPTPGYREDWLHRGLIALRPSLHSSGLHLPDLIHISVGFPSTKGLAKTGRVIGECWGASSSSDKAPHIFISPLIAEGVRALDVLVHELIHASGVPGHRADFKKLALAVGLTGKMTATEAGPGLKERLNAIIGGGLGDYPHAALSPEDRPTKKQTTRLLKAECEDCGSIIRVTQKVVDCPGLPTCACGGGFGLEGVRDEGGAE